jgi:hypothetical protein
VANDAPCAISPLGCPRKPGFSFLSDGEVGHALMSAQATITVTGGTVYAAQQIDRLHIELKS